MTDLQRCGGCKIALYCSPAHQKANWSRHKVQCNPIKQTREKFLLEEAALLAELGSTTIPDNHLAYGGRGQLYATPPSYLHARFDLIMAVLNIRTGEACEAALGHCLEMLRLCRGDNMGVRSKVPALFLRLGRDQEAFDFIKWYAVNQKSYEGWFNTDYPFLDLKGQDALKPLDTTAEKSLTLSMLSAVTLLKIRLMVDMKALRDEVKKAGAHGMTAKKKMEFLKEEARSDVLLSRPDIINRTDYDDPVADLEEQCNKMYAVVKKHNKFFWPALVNPDKYAAAIPEIYSLGSEGETVLAFRESWYSWSETDAAISYIRRVTQEDIREGGYA
jgi:hypothetical protein